MPARAAGMRYLRSVGVARAAAGVQRTARARCRAKWPPHRDAPRDRRSDAGEEPGLRRSPRATEAAFPARRRSPTLPIARRPSSRANRGAPEFQPPNPHSRAGSGQPRGNPREFHRRGGPVARPTRWSRHLHPDAPSRRGARPRRRAGGPPPSTGPGRVPAVQPIAGDPGLRRACPAVRLVSLSATAEPSRPATSAVNATVLTRGVPVPAALPSRWSGWGSRPRRSAGAAAIDRSLRAREARHRAVATTPAPPTCPARSVPRRPTAECDKSRIRRQESAVSVRSRPPPGDRAPLRRRADHHPSRATSTARGAAAWLHRTAGRRRAIGSNVTAAHRTASTSGAAPGHQRRRPTATLVLPVRALSGSAKPPGPPDRLPIRHAVTFVTMGIETGSGTAREVQLRQLCAEPLQVIHAELFRDHLQQLPKSR